MGVDQGVVNRADEAEPEGAIDPVDHGQRERERMDADPLPVRLATPAVGGDEGCAQGTDAPASDLDHRSLGTRSRDAGPEGSAFALDQAEIGLGIEVGMDVNGGGRSHPTWITRRARPRQPPYCVNRRA